MEPGKKHDQLVRFVWKKSGINSPVEVGSLSHDLQGFSTIQKVVVWDF